MGSAIMVGILGLWAALSAFLGFGPAGYAWSNWITGFLAGAAALSIVGRRRTEGWLAAAAAAWLFISGFVPGLLVSPGYWWNELLTGAALAVIGFAGLSLRGRMYMTPPATPHDTRKQERREEHHTAAR
ncbi:MAG: hypothetical protein PVJ80_18035 [Gemmatimonadota bacterium]